VTNNIRDHESESNIEPVVLDVQESVLDKDLMDLDVRLDQKREKLMNLEKSKLCNTEEKKRKEMYEMKLLEKKAKLDELANLEKEVNNLRGEVDLTLVDDDKTGNIFNFNGFQGMSKEFIEKNQVMHMGRNMVCILNKNDKWQYLNRIKIACMLMDDEREKFIFGVNEISIMVDLASLPDSIYVNHVDARQCPNMYFDGRLNLFNEVLDVSVFEPLNIDNFFRTSRSLQGILKLDDFSRNSAEYFAKSEENKLLDRITYFSKCHIFIYGNIWQDVSTALTTIVLDLLARNVSHVLIETKINNILIIINKRCIDCNAGHNRCPFTARNWVLVHIEEFSKLVVSDSDRLNFMD
jgi:hypothetical protein